MHIEEQINQNPEANNAQEEKSEKVIVEKAKVEKAETVVKAVENQINADEKNDIVDLLNDQLPSKEDEAVSVSPQIDAEEKEAIVGLLKDQQKQDEPKPVKEQAGDDGKQISAREREEIVLLLEGSKKDDKKPQPQVRRIEYDKLNKQELVEILEDVVQERDITKIKNQIAKVKTAFHHRNKEEKDLEYKNFIEGGGVKEDYKRSEDPLEHRFNAAFGQYRHNKAKFSEELEKQKAENLQTKLNILEEFKTLINSEESLKKTYDEFKRLQDAWKEIGMVPAGELNNLWQNYHFLVEKFFDKVRMNKELRDLDLKKNLEHKINICERAEELLVEDSITKSFKLLQKYHEEWREAGPVPMDKKDEIWERFKTATDKINERRKEHYLKLQEDQQKNYEAKVVLCEKAEEVFVEPDAKLKDWQRKTDQINELFKVWKTIGRAPKEQNDEIWARFRGAMDNFFNNRREFLGKLKELQTNNLNLKIDLCAKAESMKDSTDWKRTSQDLIRLQQEWKSIGPVSRRHSEKVWKRFRSACDEFFNSKSSFFKNIHVVEDENLKGKEKIVKEILAFKTDEDKKANLDALKSFQRQWMEFGHVPFKEKDRIQIEYRAAIDQLIDKMDINKLELTKSGYKNKVEIMKADSDGEWRLSKERNNITSKIKAISDDINLWENNITFFASSKQSNLLKQEFEKKIDRAKNEVKAFEEKLKILNEN